MIAAYSPVDSIAVARDMRRDAWQLRLASGAVLELRPWTWAERRRMLETASMSGQFDRDTFLRALFDTVLDPVPQPDGTADLAYVVLYILGVSEDVELPRLAEAELIAIKEFGWRPAELDAQPAAAVDRLIGQLKAERAAAAPPVTDREGDWTRIVLVPDRPKHPQDTAERLEAALETLRRTFPEREIQGQLPRRPSAAATVSSTKRAPDAATEEPGARARAAAPETSVRTAPTGVAPAETEDATRTPRGEFAPTISGMARLARPWPRDPRQGRKVSSETPERPAANSRFEWPEDPSRPVASTAAATEDFLPPVRVRVEWPEVNTTRLKKDLAWPEPDAEAAAEPAAMSPRAENPFALSELEERMADVLERAAREAGVDL